MLLEFDRPPARSTSFGGVIPWHSTWPANSMWRKLLHSGFDTPKAEFYHEPTVIWLFMIGHSLGRVEVCFGPSTQGAWDPISKHISTPDFA